MAKRLFVILADSDSVNEEELQEVGKVVSFGINNDSVLSDVEKVLEEVGNSTMGADIHIYAMHKKIVVINSGPSLNDVM